MAVNRLHGVRDAGAVCDVRGPYASSARHRCVYGAADPKAGALGTLYAVNADERLNHTFEAVSGVLGDECAELLRSFFARKRKKRMESK